MKIFIQIILTVLVLLAGIYGGWQLRQQLPETAEEHERAAGEKQHDEQTGPHGGQLLLQSDLQLEITVYESDVPPEFRVYAYRDGEPLHPENIDLVIELSRLGGQVDRFTFQPRDDYLVSNEIVTEPHSFDVRVEAQYSGRDYHWDYGQHEGRVRIPAQTAKAAGIETARAGAADIHETLSLQGQVRYDSGRLRQVRARYAGIVQAAAKTVGEQVKKGEVLARVESNDSLQTYELKSPINGVIIEQQAGSGESINEQPIYTVANLDRVWVDLAVFPRNWDRIKTGQEVRLNSLHGDRETRALIDYFVPTSDSHSQTATARIYLDNTDGRWRPGMAVSGTVTLKREKVPLAVRNSALQRFRDFDVVFARFDDIYEVRMLKLGSSDGRHTKVLGGLKPGTEYVIKNSYLIKADIEKSGAAHGH